MDELYVVQGIDNLYRPTVKYLSGDLTSMINQFEVGTRVRLVAVDDEKEESNLTPQENPTD